uniref:Golgi associated, gamma adaptin ear containing, ARF binding protein 2 n=1 Tax=Myotis lucifugus TaxID=59463 RepID=G1PJU4_MYOLU
IMRSEGEEMSSEWSDKATDPSMPEQDWSAIQNFCDQVNTDPNGPTHAPWLLAHKIQSPQEKEALYALTVLETCVNHCGEKFHNEVAKFRFLNELIKVLSPKYLGSWTTEKVKGRVIEILFSWTVWFPEDIKIRDAYQMLKKQGIVKQDPKLPVDKILPPPSPWPRSSIFDADEEKSKLLTRLLKSSHPEDLQAANRLIKSLVKEEQEKSEKVSKRVSAVEEVRSHVKVLQEMLSRYRRPGQAPPDQEALQVVYERCEKLRPTLFRLASDTVDDDDALAEILQANDLLTQGVLLYKQVMEGRVIFGNTVTSTAGDTPDSRGNVQRASLYLLLGAASDPRHRSRWLIAPSGQAPRRGSELAKPAGCVQAEWTTRGGLATGGKAVLWLLIPGPTQALCQALHLRWKVLGVLRVGCCDVLTGRRPEKEVGILGSSERSSWHLVSAERSVLDLLSPQPPSGALRAGVTLEDGQRHRSAEASLLPSPPFTTIPSEERTPLAKVSVEDLSIASSLEALGEVVIFSHHSTGASHSYFDGLLLSGLQFSKMFSVCVANGQNPKEEVPPGTKSSPGWSWEAGPLASSSSSQNTPLAQVFVPLESVKPSSLPPIIVYDRNGFRILLHFSQTGAPGHPEVQVLLLTMMSTATQPVWDIMFQVAVPKSMRVKLQPASSSQLPAFSPLMPPAVISQMLLLDNPHKEPIRLRYKLTFNQGGQPFSEVGEVKDFPDLAVLGAA